uniref:Peptidase S1 domain-containing protein n=1 Tax=Phasianus colchicus TaxID=9054 RepID=A0A669QJQ7_PHACC
MQHPQRLLLTILLLAWPLDTAGHSWSRLDRGGRALAQSRPYMAYLRGRDGGFCGGFLVAPGWVMTAAQCYSLRPLTVILGACDIQRKEESWQELQVQKYHCHPQYTNREEGHDILLLEVPRAAVVELGGWEGEDSPGHTASKGKTPISVFSATQLKSKAVVNDRVRPISFSNTRFPGGATCSVAGWGRGASNAALCEANVTISKQRDCFTIYPGLADHVLCATSSSNGVPDEVGAPGPPWGGGCSAAGLGAVRGTERCCDAAVMQQWLCCSQTGFCPLKAPSPHLSFAIPPFSQRYTGSPLVCNNRAYGIYSYPYRQRMSFYTDIRPYLPWISRVMKS